MKRLLSLILAISMMISLLPAISATEITEMSGIKVVYDLAGYLNDATLGAEVTNIGFKTIDYTNSNGFFEFAASNYGGTGYSWDDNANALKPNSYVKIITRGLQMAFSKTPWFALKIYVPKTGLYTPKVSYIKYTKKSESYIDYFLIKVTDEPVSETLEESGLTTLHSGYIGSKRCETATDKQESIDGESFDDKTIPLSAGEYYLVYYPRMVAENGASGSAAMAGNFTLDGGETAEPEVMALKLSCDEKRVFDNSTANLSATFVMSNGAMRSATGVTYQVTDETKQYASVDKDTGVISGIAPGTAEFVATATVNGREVKAKFNLPVVSSKLAGITVTYDLAGYLNDATLGAEVTSTGFKTINYTKSNGFFEFAAYNYGAGAYSWDDNASAQKPNSYVKIISRGLQMAFSKTPWFALKIYVPKKGIYTPKASYIKYNKKSETYLDYFLIKVTDDPVSTTLAEEGLTTLHPGYIGSKRCESDTGKQQSIDDESFDDMTVPLDQGEYYLVYYPREVAVNDENGHAAMAGNFTLDGGEIYPPVPMKAADVRTDSKTVVAGGGITKVLANVYMSDGTVEEADDVKITSLTPDNASVNDTFDVVIGEEVGEAKLSVAVTHKGMTFPETEISLSVVENPSTPGDGEVVKYDISSRLDKVNVVNGKESFDGLGYSALTYASTGEMWEYAANKTKGKFSWEDGAWHYTTYGIPTTEGGGGFTQFRVTAESGRNGLQMNAGYDTWWALKIKVPYTGYYLPLATYWKFGGRGAGAESYMDYFLIKNDGTKMTELLGNADLTTASGNYIGSKLSVDSSLSSGQTIIYDEQFDNKIMLDEGEYYLIYKPRNVKGTSNYAVASNFTLDGVNCVKDFYVNMKSELDWNEESEIAILPIRLDGTVVSGNYEVTYATSNPEYVDVDKNGVVKGVAEGKATITVTVSDGIGSITKTFPVTVTDNTGARDFLYNLTEKLYVNEKLLLDIDAVMNSGNVLDVGAEYITYTCAPESVAKIEDGMITALSEGEATVTATVNFRGLKKTLTNTVTVIPDEGKTGPTLYTNEMRENAQENIAKYDWAKTTQKNATKEADALLPHAELIKSQIFGEKLPRGRQLGVRGDDYYTFCRYCHAKVVGDYELVTAFTSRPWKVQCSACKRLFPSNNFEGFLELGLDESGLYFDVDRARTAHHKMLFHKDGSECTHTAPTEENTPEWYIFYGYGNPDGFLYNELYGEIRESNEDPWGELITWNKETIINEQGKEEVIDHGADLGTYRDETGKVIWQGGDMWGVDDGWGYLPGRTYADGLEERIGYVAYYNYEFWMWMYGRIGTFANAYLYTGDPKYGRAGAIILDRVADVWGSFDMYYLRNMFLNTHGGSGYGAAVGRLNDSYIARGLLQYTDMLYPMAEDEELIRILAASAEATGHENDKASSERVWKNWEEGIVLTTYQMLKDGRIQGNFGQPQGVAGLAAIVVGKQPETNEILNWIYATDTGNGKTVITGGNLNATLINRVDRDGMGDEASPRYNTSWVTNLSTFADATSMYTGEGDYQPYNIPKFIKMYTPQIDFLLTNSKHPNIGDAGSVATVTLNGGTGAWLQAFARTDIEEYKKKIANYLYTVNGNKTDGFRYDIFTENPESLEEDIKKYVDTEKKTESTILTGYGVAILRDGAKYDSASALTAKNTMRDIWVTFGRTASHGHNDALNLGMDAYGLDVAPDLGYPEDTSYTPNRSQWVSAAVSHNTVVVNEANSDLEIPHGYPLHFDDTEMVKLIDVDESNRNSQTEKYRRSVVMIKANDDVSYAVDFFRVKGGNTHTYSFHSQAENAYPIRGIELTPQVDENGNWIGTYAGVDGKDPETGEWIEYGPDPFTTDEWGSPVKYNRGYTWMDKIRRDKDPEQNITVEFDVQDYNKILKDGKNIKLRLTQMNNFTPDEVAIVAGYVPIKEETKKLPRRLDYLLVHNRGENLDSLFTTVLEPYKGERYVSDIKTVDVSVKAGNETVGEDMARAVKVTHTSGRTDYVVYASNTGVTYTVSDTFVKADGTELPISFDFRGFVGVYTVNQNGSCIYRYVNDGTIIGEETEKTAAYTGTVTGFQKGYEVENYIDVEMQCDDISDLEGRVIYVDNDRVENGAYRILSVSEEGEGLKEGSIRLDIGTVTLIRSLIDEFDFDKGFVYNIREGQTFSIPTSFADESLPEFEPVSDNLSTSAGSSISVNISAKSPITTDTPTITYIGATLPRGASLNSETGVFTWKPDNSQVGDNHVAITARDSDGREATIHFDIAVYGSTTGGSSSDKTETPEAGTTDTPAGGGGGGGGGGAAPTDKPDDTTDKNEESENQTGDNGESGEGEKNEGDTDNTGTENSSLRFTDLASHAWAADSINTLADDGVIKGTTATTYSPANNITRADFALLLVRAFELSSDNVENFADVSASDYFAPELAIARNTGIVNGIGDNKYAPRNTITRQDMMVIVYRALQTLNVEFGIYDEPNYKDFATVADYAKEAVSALIGAGLVNGKNGHIAPTDYTTRAEVAVLIKRILDYIK